MKHLLLILVLFYVAGASAESITARYPDYNHSKDGACNDAKLYIKNRAYSECPDGVSGSISRSCENCTKKMRFNTPTWTCSGRADFSCKGKSSSQAESDASSSYGDKAVRKMRGSLRKNTPRGQSPCLQYPNGSACRSWKQSMKTVGGVRN